MQISRLQDEAVVLPYLTLQVPMPNLHCFSNSLDIDHLSMKHQSRIMSASYATVHVGGFFHFEISQGIEWGVPFRFKHINSLPSHPQPNLFPSQTSPLGRCICRHESLKEKNSSNGNRCFVNWVKRRRHCALSYSFLEKHIRIIYPDAA